MEEVLYNMAESFLIDFINQYGMTILYAIVCAIGSAVALGVKSLLKKYVNDKTKKTIAKTVVAAVEQMYKELGGEEKLNLAITSMTEMLAEKGITVTELEIRMLLEAAVGEANDVFKKHVNSEDELPEESGNVDEDSNAE